MKATIFCPSCEDDTQHYVAPAEPQTYFEPRIDGSVQCESCDSENESVTLAEALEASRRSWEREHD